MILHGGCEAGVGDNMFDGEDSVGTSIDETPSSAGSGWHAPLATAAIGYALLVLAVPCPQVLPFGLVVSPGSLLSLLIGVALASAAGLLVLPLRRLAPIPLAALACGLLPTAFSVSFQAHDVPAFTFAFGLSMSVGVACWALRRRAGGRGAIVPACLAVVALGIALVALTIVGPRAFVERPDLFASGYADAADHVGQGQRAGLAERLVSAMDASGPVGERTGVIVSPFCADWEGRFMSWGTDPDGRRVLLVASQYVASYTEGELADMACGMMGKDDNVATLYTRWLDGRVWLWAQGVRE